MQKVLLRQVFDEINPKYSMRYLPNNTTFNSQFIYIFRNKQLVVIQSKPTTFSTNYVQRHVAMQRSDGLADQSAHFDFRNARISDGMRSNDMSCPQLGVRRGRDAVPVRRQAP